MQVRELVTRLGFDGKDAERAAKSFDGQIDALRTNLQRLVVGVGAAAASLFGLAKTTADAGDEIAKTSAQIGLTADGLQGLRYAGQIAGIKVGALTQAMGDFNRRLGEAQSGTGKTAETLATLGVQMRDSSGAMRSNEAILFDFADALARVPDASLRAAMTMDVMGRSGARMQAFLAGGSEEIRKNMAEFEALGGMMGAETLRQSEAFQDAMLRVRTILTGLRNEIGGELLPVLNDILDGLKEWFLANRALIRQNISVLVRTLVTVIGTFWRTLMAIVSAVDDAAQAMGGWGRVIRLVTAALIALAAVRVAKWALALAAGIKAAGGAMALFGAILKRIPLVLIMTLVAALLEDIFLWVRGHNSALESVLGPWKEFKATAVDALETVWGWVVKVGDRLSGLLPGNWMRGSGMSISADEVARQNVMAMAGTGGVGSVTINSPMEINVPPGTTQEQTVEIGRQVRSQVNQAIDRRIRETLGDIPDLQ